MNSNRLPVEKPPGAEVTTRSERVIPNSGIVLGNVLDVKGISHAEQDIQSDRTVYTVELLVQEITDVEGMRNLFKEQVGKVIVVYSKDESLPGLIGREIKGRVSRQGDERGFKNWLWDIQVQGKYR